MSGKVFRTVSFTEDWWRSLEAIRQKHVPEASMACFLEALIAMGVRASIASQADAIGILKELAVPRKPGPRPKPKVKSAPPGVGCPTCGKSEDGGPNACAGHSRESDDA